jgi:endonuclease-3
LPSPRPSTRSSASLVRRIAKVNDLLLSLYGPRKFRAGDDPLDVLIKTILSQNTSDVNSSRAFLRLRRRFHSWRQAANAYPEDIERCISIGGLAAIKSLRIKSVLQTIKDDAGSYSLSRLKKLSPTEALDYLCSLDGVGRKTAACVLLFSLGLPVFPVDTHVNRLAQRLGWLPLGSPAEKTGAVLDQLVPAPIKYSLHLNLVAHGRAVCRARNPRCPACILRALCPKVGVS